MGVVSTQNRFASIPIRQRGQPRFARPAEDEPANGPVVTYHLSPEEIARRYGPPVEVQRKSRKPKLDKQSLAGMLRTLTVNEVAWRYQLPQRYVIKLCETCGLELDGKGRLTVGTHDENPENTGGDGMAHGDKVRAAREALPKDELEKLIHEMSDQKIAEAKGLAYWQVRRLKDEYGLVGVIGRGGYNRRKTQKGRENMGFQTYTSAKSTENRQEHVEEQTQEQEGSCCLALPEAEPKRITIAMAVKHREELVRKLDKLEAELKRIDDVFDTTEIEV